MQIEFQGKQIEVQDVEILTSSEPFRIYQLSDGAELRIKNVLLQAMKAVNEKAPDGKPLYIVKCHEILDVRYP